MSFLISRFPIHTLEEITSLAEQNKVSWDVVRALVAYTPRESHTSVSAMSRTRRGADLLRAMSAALSQRMQRAGSQKHPSNTLMW